MISSTTTALVKMISPEITAFAERHISFSPCVFSFSLKIGMNAAVNAPSPSSRRNRLGIWNASRNALATHVVPMKFAYTISRTMPRMRLSRVAAAMAPEAFNIFDTARRLKIRAPSPKSKVARQLEIGIWPRAI